jgi:hypothetical protein
MPELNFWTAHSDQELKNSKLNSEKLHDPSKILIVSSLKTFNFISNLIH